MSWSRQLIFSLAIEQQFIMCERWYWPPSWFMVVPPRILISWKGTLTWFLSIIWSVMEDLWVMASDSKVIGTDTAKYKRWGREAREIRKWGHTIMNSDERQYHLSHIPYLMNFCSIKNYRIENKLTTPRHPLKSQQSSRWAQCHPGVEKGNRCSWNVHNTQVGVILFGLQNMEYIYGCNLTILLMNVFNRNHNKF